MSIIVSLEHMAVSPAIDKKLAAKQICDKLRDVKCDQSNHLWLFLGCQLLEKLDKHAPLIRELYANIVGFFNDLDPDLVWGSDCADIYTCSLAYRISIGEEPSEELGKILPPNEVNEETFHNTLELLSMKKCLLKNDYIINFLNDLIEESQAYRDVNDSDLLNFLNDHVKLHQGEILGVEEDDPGMRMVLR
ncbi:MAG: hypothetical protein JSS53_00625 [Proteobacteria bacterium]|nr:hypothetical protein [Pseudomonadota bacterium]